MYGQARSMLAALAFMAATAASASAINGINGGMPNRISMNVTVPKQTQGATFGEKVQAGLHAAGGALANGASLFVACGTSACAIALPDGTGYLADLQSLTFSPLDPAQGAALRKGTVATGASLLGGALPGGSIVSAAVSSVSSLGGGSGAAAASYAATGRTAAPAAPTPLTNRARDDGGIDVVEPLVDGDYALTLEVMRPTGAAVRTAKAPAPTAPAADRVRMRLIITSEGGTLRVRRDSPANSIATQNGGG
jgi:hypothetical protein